MTSGHEFIYVIMIVGTISMAIFTIFGAINNPSDY